ncbi:MAG: hypothetical protein ACYTFW_01025 [Planctomycetota bacterium]|jgi:hypothetical protein
MAKGEPIQIYKGFHIFYNITHDWLEAYTRTETDMIGGKQVFYETANMHHEKREDLLKIIDRFLKRKKNFPIPALRVAGRHVPDLGRITSFIENKRHYSSLGEVWFSYSQDGQIDGHKPGYTREKLSFHTGKFVKPTEANIKRAKQMIEIRAEIKALNDELDTIVEAMEDPITIEDMQ